MTGDITRDKTSTQQIGYFRKQGNEIKQGVGGRFQKSCVRMASHKGLLEGIMRRGWTQKTWRKCILEEEMGSLKALRSQ